MNIGPLNKRLEIQSSTDTRDGLTGAMAKTWATVTTVWAQIEPLSGNETWRARQAQSDATHRITIRWYSGLTPAYRFLYGSRIFNIESVMNTDERGSQMVCTCTEEVT